MSKEPTGGAPERPPYCVVLAGDSVIDNASYVEKNEPDMLAQVAREMKSGDWVLRVARDGGIIRSILPQLGLIPETIRKNRCPLDPTHIVLSVGGNDALRHSVLLRSERVITLAEGLDFVAHVRRRFAEDYETMLMEVKGEYDLPLVVSTIYYPCFLQAPLAQRRSSALLSLFNDCIISLAGIYKLPVVDLRWISTEAEHYANPIEPSAVGAGRIAEIYARVVETHDFGGPSAVYAHPDAEFDPMPFVSIQHARGAEHTFDRLDGGMHGGYSPVVLGAEHADDDEFYAGLVADLLGSRNGHDENHRDPLRAVGARSPNGAAAGDGQSPTSYTVTDRRRVRPDAVGDDAAVSTATLPGHCPECNGARDDPQMCAVGSQSWEVCDNAFHDRPGILDGLTRITDDDATAVKESLDRAFPNLLGTGDGQDH